MPPKNKGKGQKAPKPAFDEAALSQLTAKIDTNLSQSKERPPEKRKRDDYDSRDSNPKKRQAQEPKGNRQSPKKAGKESSSSLLDEIRLLGGDESDLELVTGVDSDAEEGQSANAGKSSSELDRAFQKELAKFASGLGFEQVREESVAADDEPDEEQEEDDVEEVSDFSDDEGDVQEPPAAPEKPQVQEKLQNQKKKGKLVSTHHLVAY